MAIVSKYLQPAKHNRKIVPKNGILSVDVIEVPKFSMKVDELDGQPICGTDLFFEGRLFYPCTFLQKGEKGWLIIGPNFITKDDIFFFNPHLKKEETELDLQGWARTKEPDRWRYYLSELYDESLKAVKLAIGGHVNGQNNSTD